MSQHSQAPEQIEPEVRDSLDLALRVGRQRREMLHHLRVALEEEDESAALEIARRLCGLRVTEQTPS
jgi:hypothetical protein